MMTSRTNNDGRLAFGRFSLDARTLELWRDGTRVPLEPLPTRILLRLARDAGSLVGRRELVELGWPGLLPSVAEQSLNTCIYQIRRALRAGGGDGVHLETLRGRGYRLSVVSEAARDGGPVRAPEGSADPEGGGPIEDGSRALGPRSRRPAVRRAFAWTGVGVAAAASTVLLAMPPRGPAPLPVEAGRMLERARYLAVETGDPRAALAVLDSGRVMFRGVAALHAEWAELAATTGTAEEASAAARRALELDPRSATAQRTVAVIAITESDWRTAEGALERALSFDAADTRTHAAFAFLRLIQRRFADADRLLQDALRVDPLSTTLYRDAGLIYLLMGRFEEADKACRRVLRFDPRSVWATDCLFDATVLAGRLEEAAHWGRRLLELSDAALPPGAEPAERTVAATEAWRMERWAAAVERGAYPFGLALAYAANGHEARAIDALRTAAERPRLGLLSMGVDPRLASLRGHPEFRDIAARLRLPGSDRRFGSS